MLILKDTSVFNYFIIDSLLNLHGKVNKKIKWKKLCDKVTATFLRGPDLQLYLK